MKFNTLSLIIIMSFYGCSGGGGGVNNTNISPNSTNNSTTEQDEISLSLSLLNKSASKIKISWNDIDGEESATYRVYYTDNSSDSFDSVADVVANGTPANNATSSITEFEVTGLNYDTEYRLNVLVSLNGENSSVYESKVISTDDLSAKFFLELNKDYSSTFPNMGSTPIEYNGERYFSIRGSGYDYEFWKLNANFNLEKVFDLSEMGYGYTWHGIEFNGKLYLTTYGQTGGQELYVYDGGSDFTLVADIYGSGSSVPKNFIVFKDKLYFHATDGVNGNELWVYDGVNPPSMVTNLHATSNGLDDKKMIVIGEYLYFSGTNVDNGNEIFRYDGTTAVELVHDLTAGSGGSSPDYLTEFNGDLYFTATTSAHGRELFKYDPDTDTMEIAVDITSGSSSFAPIIIGVSDSKIYLGKLNSIVYTFDGSTHTQISGITKFKNGFLHNGNLFYSNDNGDYDNLYKYDGLTHTRIDEYVNSRSNSPLAAPFSYEGNLFYFSKVYGHDYQLLSLDSNDEFTIISLPDPYTGAGAEITEAVKYEGNYYFSGEGSSQYGIELIKYNPSLDEITYFDLYEGNYDSEPHYFIEYNGSLYFISWVDEGGQLWRITGDEDPEAVGSPVDRLETMIVFQNELYLNYDPDTGTGTELYKYNDETDDFSLVFDIDSGGSGSRPRHFSVINDNLYFVASVDDGYQLYKYDGSTLTELSHTNDSGGSFDQGGRGDYNFLNWNEKIYFAAMDNTGDHFLYELDGASISKVSTSHYLGNGRISLFNDKIYFYGNDDGSSSYDLWTYDGVVFEDKTTIDDYLRIDSPFYEMEGELYFYAYGTIDGEIFKINDVGELVSLAIETNNFTGFFPIEDYFLFGMELHDDYDNVGTEVYYFRP